MVRDEPVLTVRPARSGTRAVALVLHGGAQFGVASVRPWRLAYLRMVPLARALSAAGRRHGLTVALLRNRVRGWNAPQLDPVRDARWALGRLRAEFPGAPVVLVGHSMGGRVALRVADDPAVVGVCALAPWTPGDEPVDAVRGRSVLIVHGTRDRITGPADSRAFADRAQATAARIARFEVADEGHAMLRRSPVWTGLVTGFTLATLGMPVTDGEPLASAWTKPAPHRLRIPL
ncbi:serine aminopeptidase S33 family [Prauserella shujinwangii]|uniref:Serine aminopeptidase S33 family n=1 Tax=Prauserella shujinwangii TaxID=1453103 RepID=A0A2T0LR96_9PSEU|nr:alpha/beta fold hydrolase [Prauserella shujinwangii]PRX46008.1 serine aminopeptidase S33 family [Prauserella shujinwangii]